VIKSSDAETHAIAAVLGGRRESFRVLVEAHQDRVWRLCLLMLVDAGLAEDAAQEAFASAFRRLPLFSPERGSFGTWLLTISRNLCCNVRRKKMPVTLAILPDQPGETGSTGPLLRHGRQPPALAGQPHHRVHLLCESLRGTCG